MITSMTHWVQLMQIDTSDKKMFEFAEREYGAEKVTQMKMEYASLNAMEQKSYVSRNAVEFVQNQAPCTNMYKKAQSKGSYK